MTRINTLAPSLLTDEWMLAEYRELPRIINKMKAGKQVQISKIPKAYILGTGHETFFYNKLLYLQKRHKQIVKECLKRGKNIAFTQEIDLTGIDPIYCQDWQPNNDDHLLNIQRLCDRFDDRKRAYHYRMVKLDCDHSFNRYLKIIEKSCRL